MKLSNRAQIEALAHFQSNDYETTSLYLDTDKSRRTAKEIKLMFKNLYSKSLSLLDQRDLSRAKKDSLGRDLEKIKTFFTQQLNSHGFPGLAVFSCCGENFWQAFELPGTPRNRIVFDKDPYVRPLSAILNEHERISVLVFDRKEAKWYDVVMGEIQMLESLKSDVPQKVREGGWEGYESKRIERHIKTHLRDHFKRTAKTTFDLFKVHGFDWLFLGCADEYGAELEPLLHPYLQTKLRGRLKVKPSDSPDRVLREAMALEKNLKAQDEQAVLHQYTAELKKGGLAVSGLKRTLQSLNRSAVQTLLVTTNFSKPGRICPKCQFLYADETRCASCSIKTEPVQDIIDEAVESALDKNCQVRHITPPSQLRRYGNIGALLRFKS